MRRVHRSDPESEGESESGAAVITCSVAALRRVTAAVLVAGLVLVGGAATAETLKDVSGRRLMTGKKLVQIDVLGVEPSETEVIADGILPRAPGSRVLSAGRYLRARPAQPVSVGLIGCSGCMSILEAVSPVVVERRAVKRNASSPR